MKMAIKRVAIVAIVIVVVIAVFVVVTVGMRPANSAGSETLDLTTEFLSTVVGLDMTKYSLDLPSPPPGYDNRPLPTPAISDPADMDGLDVEGPSYDFKSEEDTLETMSMFYNGHLKSLKIYSRDTYVYSVSPPTDIRDQANDLLQRYQTFLSQNYDIDGSFIVPMQNVLNSVDELSPTSVTVGNINFQVSESGDKTRLQWIYTEGSIVMERKRVELEFRDNIFVSFMDTWSLYKVSGLSVISSEEATAIALEAAQKVELHVGYANGTSETVKVPDLSNAPYDVNFAMLPYRGAEEDFPSKIARDPLTLYPYWQFHFYFGEKIGGCIGVQVGVWGDTKEIIYASGYGVLSSGYIVSSFP